MCDDPIVANTKRRPLWRPAVRQRVLEACLGKPRLDSHLRGLVATCEACEPSRASLHGRWARGGNGPLTHHRARDDKRGGAEQHSLYRRSHCQPAPPSPRPPARPPVAGSSWLFPFRNWHWTRAGAAWMKASTGAAWGRASMHAHTGSASWRPGAVHPEAWQAAMGGIAGPAREASGGNHRHPAQHPLLLL